MAWYEILGLLVGMLLLFMAVGLPVVFAFFAVNLVGAFVFMGGDKGLVQLLRNATDAVQSFALLPIPLFIFMGEVMFHTGVAARAIDAVDRLIARVPGRLSLVAITGGTIFSSLSGSTIANTAMLSSTLLPEMTRRGYQPTITVGPIVAVGGLAMLIPPSALAVLLGSVARIPIGELLVASIIPAFILAALFFAYVILRCRLDPSLAPPYDVAEYSWRERLLPFARYVLPLLGIFVVVVGSIIGGFATPTESAALGAAASIAAAAAYRRLTRANFVVSVRETLRLTVMTLFIICGSITFSQILAFTQASSGLSALVTGAELGPLWVLVGMLGISAGARLLHGPGEHDDDHRAAVHAGGRGAGAGDRLVRRADADGARDQPRHAALRPPAVRRQGRGAADPDGRHHPLGGAVHRARARRGGAADRLSAADAVASRADGALARRRASRRAPRCARRAAGPRRRPACARGARWRSGAPGP
jgi:tripartite ATP-independent transporter DctM subunit